MSMEVEKGPPKAAKRTPAVGAQVRRWRGERGLTLAGVADRTGLNIGYLSQIENGKAVPSIGCLTTLSDALDVPKVLQLYERFRGRCKLAFGVGTNLTNDLGYQPLQIVIKMVRCNGQPVAKLSDSPGKNMCDDKAYLAYLRQVFGIAQPTEEAS